MVGERVSSYKEKPFIDYFERLRNTGMDFDEIQTKLPQLQNYYHDMVVKGVFYVDIPTLEGAFIEWRDRIKLGGLFRDYKEKVDEDVPTTTNYWYFTEVVSCVLCGKETRNKERRYTPKPDNPSERTVWREDACHNHFM